MRHLVKYAYYNGLIRARQIKIAVSTVLEILHVKFVYLATKMGVEKEVFALPKQRNW